MNHLERVLLDIKKGENIDLYVTVLLSSIVLVFSAFGLASQSLIGSLTLALLGLIAISLLGNRYRTENLVSSLASYRNDLFTEEAFDSLDKDIEEAEELWMVGETLAGTIYRSRKLLQEKLHKGHKIKVLITNPAGLIAETTAKRTDTDPERQKARIYQSLEWLCKIGSEAPECLQVRVTDYPLSYKVYAVNPESNSGLLYLEHLPFRTFRHLRLTMSTADSKWYSYFFEEVQALWQEAKDYSCEETLHSIR